MGYKWLNNYRPESEVTETTPGVFTVMLLDEETGEFVPKHGIGQHHIEQAKEKYSSMRDKLQCVLQKMKSRGNRNE